MKAVPEYLVPTLIAGILAGVLFLIIFGIGLGFIFMFLPSLPLFVIGLKGKPESALLAAAVAFVMAALLAGLPAACMFLLFLGWPAWYIVRKSLLLRADGAGQAEWFPIGLIFTYLTLYACALVALVTFYYAGQPGGLPGLLAQNIHETFSDLEGDYGEVIDALAGRWSFFVFPSTIWLWGLGLYGHAWIVQWALVRKGAARRPDFAMELFPLPGWMLTLLAIAALASLIGSPSLSFLGKSTLMSVLFPYFLLGAAVLQNASRAWPSRRIYLFFIYFIIFAQFWPALILSGLGLIHQIKRLSSGGSWSR